jgi:hypothetical protein
MADRGSNEVRHSTRRLPLLRIAVLTLLPLAAVGEIVAGEVQHRRIPTARDWSDAAAAASAMRRDGDVIVVAPRWAEQSGRMALGFGVPPAPGPLDQLFDARVAGRSDLAVYKRALVLSLRSKDDPMTKGWRLVEEKKLGHVSLRVLQNPAPELLVRDLVEEVDQTTKITRVFPKSVDQCTWETGTTPHMPGLFAGPVAPPARWMCPPNDPAWSWVGPTVITDLDYAPRRCLWVHPHADGVLNVEYPSRPIGKRVVGHAGIHVWNEREKKGAPVFVRISIAGKEVAKLTHVDGEGWARFEGSTEEFAGTSQPVKIETWAQNGLSQFRELCVAAQLRN